jgi:hypothetical protein
MKNGYMQEHWSDQNGNPAGGVSSGCGFTISWQNGPLGRHAQGCGEGLPCVEGCTRRAPNGAFVEDVLDAVIERIDFYQRSGFNCQENEDAVAFLHRLKLAMEMNAKD